ncbi:hypothetical protein PHAGE_BARTON_16 [Acinetobacter phage Barton]|nr:hypothetical protein PHAGE_BARTON_16 [Acinetobacter phage Barton]
MSLDKFFTREISNKGIELPLPLPNGMPSGDHLVIVGKWSDTFRTEEAEMKREAVQAASKYQDDKIKRAKAMYEIEVKFLSSLVVGWSFDVEFNQKNVQKLLFNAPQIMELVDKAVVNNSLFFGKPSIDSLNTQEPTSNSTESQKAQSDQQDNT